ncbi:MAG: hypothetical protein A2Z29_07140 [Chloroflexi bacterium RBG_16_56_11]|nr:MAG: hypothetical protein A2Z29_07140 [Chloroflexi bacterium RBG_16_56_11]
MVEKKVTKDGWGKKLRAPFMAGLLLVIPVAASILILIWVFNSVDNILAPVVRYIFGRNIPGVGFGATIILIYLVGVIAKNFIGKRLVRYSHSLMTRVPIFRSLYGGIRQIVETFAAPDKAGFMQVVLVEFPRLGMWTVGFVTNEIVLDNGEKLISVLIPTSPTPWSGFFQILKEKDIIRTSMSVENAVKMIVSGGMTVPPDILSQFNIQ